MENNCRTFLTALTFLFLLSGFTFLISNVWADDWTDEKAKSLGVPLLPIGTVILCESEKRTGFNWKNGTYVQTNFTNVKRVLKKTEASECLKTEFDLIANAEIRNYGS